MILRQCVTTSARPTFTRDRQGAERPLTMTQTLTQPNPALTSCLIAELVTSSFEKSCLVLRKVSFIFKSAIRQ